MLRSPVQIGEDRDKRSALADVLIFRERPTVEEARDAVRTDVSSASGFCAFAGEVGKGGRKGNVREHGATPTRIAI